MVLISSLLDRQLANDNTSHNPSRRLEAVIIIIITIIIITGGQKILMNGRIARRAVIEY